MLYLQLLFNDDNPKDKYRREDTTITTSFAARALVQFITLFFDFSAYSTGIVSLRHAGIHSNLAKERKNREKTATIIVEAVKVHSGRLDQDRATLVHSGAETERFRPRVLIEQTMINR